MKLGTSEVRRLLRRGLDAADRFFFAPASAAPLAVLRIGLGAVLLFEATLVAPAFREMCGSDGIVQEPLGITFSERGAPWLGRLVDAILGLGVGEHAIVTATGVLYIIALVAMTAGLWTRRAAAVAWLTHLALMTMADAAVYGSDEFANVFLFYLVWMPSGATFSLDRRLGRAPAEPSGTARLALRVLQIQLSIVYFATGLEKTPGRTWWNGDAIWRAIVDPSFQQLDFFWLANHPWVAAAAGWGVLLVEMGYPIFIWIGRTRRIWIALTVLMHASIALFMGLHVFGGIMAVFTVALFAVPAEPAAGPSLPDPSSAVARQWSLRLLSLFGVIAVCAELVGIVGHAPTDFPTVPVDDLAVIQETPPASPPSGAGDEGERGQGEADKGQPAAP